MSSGAARARRAARRRWVLLAVALVVVPTVAALLAARGQGGALDPTSAAPQGARALAHVLADQGVAVSRVERVSAAQRALAGSAAAATLVVTGADLLDPARLRSLARRAAVVVLLEPDRAALAAVTPAVRVRASGGGVADDPPPVVAAGCDDPDAAAAGRASGGGEGLRAAPAAAAGDAAVVTCFGGSYAVAVDGERSVRVFGQGAVASNARIDEAGNAALALRAMGGEPRLVWLVSSPLDAAAGDGDPQIAALLPPWVVVVAVQLLLAGAVAVLWRARRLGPLVTEPLPVVVRAAETTAGRAALYRASGDRAAAARVLRAAARWRLATRFGVPPATGVDEVARVAAAATGRSTQEVSWVLCGPEPADDAQLVALADHLAALDPGQPAVRPHRPVTAPAPSGRPTPPRRNSL